MRKITFVTSNKHKLEEMNLLLAEFDIELVQERNLDYIEDKEKEMKEICEEASSFLAEKIGKEVIVEDTGLYFEAYNNFPGAQPKFVFNSIGFDGIFRLLEGKSRKAYFKTVIGYCKPGRSPKTFEGIMHGEITSKVFCPEKDAMPYDHIFIPDGHDRAIVEMSLQEKNTFSQRAKATLSLGEYLSNN
jgi:XTP/dITP diphosphohydrolase